MTTIPSPAPPAESPAAPPETPREPPSEPPRRPGAFARLAGFLERRARLVVVLGVLFAAAAGAFSSSVVERLDPPGRAEDPSSESVLAKERVERAAGVNPEAGLVVLLPTRSRAQTREVRRVLRGERLVARVSDVYSTGSRAFLARRGRASYVVANLKPTSEKAGMHAAERVKERLAEAVPSAKLGGIAAADQELVETADKDLKRAELLAFPILLLLSLWFFRGFVAALLPPIVGAITVALTLLALRAASESMDLAFTAINLVTGLGLGLAIDFSLFMVSRYREELAAQGDSGAALRRTMQTAGRSVLFSALTVSTALAALLVFPQRFLYSMGVGGVAVPLIAAAVALIFLPAVLALLGPRVNALAPARLKRAADREARMERGGIWYRISRWVMRRAAATAIVSSVVLILIGLPFLGIKFLPITSEVLPASSEARQVDEAIARDFPPYRTSPILMAIRTPGSAKASVASGQMQRFSRRIRRLDGVREVSPARAISTRTVQIEVIPRAGPLTDRTQDLVRDIRALDSKLGIAVGGQTAAYVDQKASLAEHIPLALAIVVIATLVVLFVMTGSVVLPVKALLMNVLTLSAAFGILVLIFQDGRLEGVLDYDSLGGIDSMQPILLAAVVIGLSTDYAVFLLSRIKEARDAGADEAESVAIGLERTGRIVTGAAILFCVAIGAFATSGIVFVKQVGVGTAVAVLIDAFIIRALLVPSLMALLGRRNWWAPGPLRRLHRRIGVQEG